MAQANLGRVRPIFKGTYNPLESYTLLDLVDYLGDLYSPKQPTTGNLPTDGLYWTLVLKQYGDISTYQGAPRVYALGEYTKENGVLYVSQQANNSGVVPSTDTDYSHWKPSNFDGNITNYATSAVSVTVANPVGRNTSVLDYTGATGTITLPSGASMTIGGRVLIKKRNATMGSVNINKAGTDAVQWGATQLRLYSDGDYWLLMWDGFKWCLLNGYETGSNANGKYVKYADGTLVCDHKLESGVGNTLSGSLWLKLIPDWTFPMAFSVVPEFSAVPDLLAPVGSPISIARLTADDYTTTTLSGLYVWYAASSATCNTRVALTARGIWF